MHDIDRTMGRTNMEAFEFQGEEEMNEFQSEGEGVLHEEELNELATELLSVANEQELEQFLGGLIKKVGSAVGSFVKSPVGQQLGGMLKGVAKKALPIAGAALGNLIAPGVGGAIGGKLGSAAGSLFGLELEGLSHEDREYEVAKQFVRLAADATHNATKAPPGTPPAKVAQSALTQAAQKFAPGLLAGGPSAGSGGARGRWIRKGNKIVLYGV
jgi:uncharacterized protein (DUF697 family)